MKNVALYGPNGHLIKADYTKGSAEARALRQLARATRSNFKSGDTNRLNADWVASNEAINTILNRQLKTIRARSRWLEQNNPYFISAINTMTNYCVGTGFELQMAVSKQVYDADLGEYVVEEQDGFNDYVESLWSDWAADCVRQAGPMSPDTFVDVQHLCMRRMMVDGEVLLHMVPDKSNGTVPLYIEPIDADNLDTNISEWKGNPVVLGVEVDKRTWKPVAYWIYSTSNQHPQRPSKINLIRVPATEIIHVYRKHFPYQLRGIPFAAGVSQKFFDIDGYNESQMIRNKIAAAFGVLLKTTEDTAPIPGLEDTDASDTEDADGFPTDADGNILSTVAPGIMGRLPKGVEPFLVNPTAPENTYGMFLSENLKAIGAGTEIGLSYTSLTRDTTKTTFAGGRLAENMDIQAYRPFMQFFSNRVCGGTLRYWMGIANLSGALTMPGYDINPRYWQRHRWMPSGWPQGINPLQDANAAAKRMSSGIKTLADECAWLGLDWKAQAHKEAKIKRYRERLGLPGRPYATKNEEADGGEPDLEQLAENAEKALENATV